MKLIADSGSTKTDWRLLSSSGAKYSFKSEGINPFFHTPDSVAEILRATSFEPFAHRDIKEVYFYSAGVSNIRNRKLMEEGFAKVFTSAKLNIMHDLLGAARALFQNETGITCILGTGSNSCFYDESKIKMVLGGHGYILGDEGSGMHIGRKVVRDFMSDLMPDDAYKMFNAEFGLTKDEISFAVYKKTFPNRYLASFSVFVQKNIEHPYFLALVDDAFMKFFERYIIQFPNYKEYPVRVLGSVGYHFEAQLRKRAEMYGIDIDKIIKAPIDGLVQYHLNTP
jgi:N-acetylglucosamine kinase-like BadF-type ATPase